MKKYLLLPLAALLVMMMFSTMFATSGTAHAASVPTMHTQTHAVALAPMHALIPAVTCSGNGCTGTDPFATGCANSSNERLVSHTTVTDSNGVTAQIDEEFSAICNTNWTEVHEINASGNQCFFGEINRLSGPDGGAVSEEFSSCAFTFINTNQIFSPHNVAQACGLVNDSASFNDFGIACASPV